MIVVVSVVVVLVVFVYVITYNETKLPRDNTVGATVTLMVILFSMTIVPVCVHVVVTGTTAGTRVTYTTVFTYTLGFCEACTMSLQAPTHSDWIRCPIQKKSHCHTQFCSPKLVRRSSYRCTSSLPVSPVPQAQQSQDQAAQISPIVPRASSIPVEL